MGITVIGVERDILRATPLISTQFRLSDILNVCLRNSDGTLSLIVIVLDELTGIFNCLVFFPLITRNPSGLIYTFISLIAVPLLIILQVTRMSESVGLYFVRSVVIIG